jgi:hypothetical protein
MAHSISRVVIVAAAALAAIGGGTAHGQELAYADGASDVYQLQPDNSATLYGDMVNTDVVSVLVDHRNRTIKAKFGYTDLARTQHFIAALSVRTSDSRRYRVVVNALSSWRGETAFETWNGKEIECASIRHAIDYDANTVKLAMDTDCLEKPRWVQVGLVTASTPDGNTVYADDAQAPDFPRWSTWSSKVRRG